MNQTKEFTDAKAVAGYGEHVTPCEPRRSSYPSGFDGNANYRVAAQRWATFRAALLEARS